MSPPSRVNIPNPQMVSNFLSNMSPYFLPLTTQQPFFQAQGFQKVLQYLLLREGGGSRIPCLLGRGISDKYDKFIRHKYLAAKLCAVERLIFWDYVSTHSSKHTKFPNGIKFSFKHVPIFSSPNHSTTSFSRTGFSKSIAIFLFSACVTPVFLCLFVSSAS